MNRNPADIHGLGALVTAGSGSGHRSPGCARRTAVVDVGRSCGRPSAPPGVPPGDCQGPARPGFGPGRCRTARPHGDPRPGSEHAAPRGSCLARERRSAGAIHRPRIVAAPCPRARCADRFFELEHARLPRSDQHVFRATLGRFPDVSAAGAMVPAFPIERVRFPAPIRTRGKKARAKAPSSGRCRRRRTGSARSRGPTDAGTMPTSRSRRRHEALAPRPPAQLEIAGPARG